MKPVRTLILLATTMLAPATLATTMLAPAVALAGQPLDCAALASLSLPNTKITSVQDIPADTVRPVGHPTSPFLPAHCRINGIIDARPSFVPGNTLGIGFEVRLPTGWNQRFLFQGGGGFDGVVAEANGVIVGATAGDQTALGRGFAVASTDAGHESDVIPPGIDTRAALDSQARIDNGYNAVLQVDLLAQKLMQRFYGAKPAHSYFDGCSNGGRQAMVATQRYADLFDGVVAGDPAFDLTGAQIAWDWNVRTLQRIAPPDANGNPDLTQALSDADLTLLSNAVLDQCDARDGLKDGLISDTIHQCSFDPAVLQCRNGATTDCLTRPKVEAIQRIYNGAHTYSGEPLYSPWTNGGEAGPSGWRLWFLGQPTFAALQLSFVAGWMQYVAFTPPQPGFDYRDFNFDRDPQRMGVSTHIWTADKFNEKPFFHHGGKMIAYHGISDPAFSAYHFIDWFNALGQRFPAEAQQGQSARLFLIPGMTHCSGGQALDQFDPLSAIVDWVENGTAPDRLVATGNAFPGRSRPLCPYPQVAVYSGSGSTDDAANFACAAAP